MYTITNFLKAKAAKKILDSQVLNNTRGGIAAPLILWFLGVPGLIVILLWLFVFRG